MKGRTARTICHDVPPGRAHDGEDCANDYVELIEQDGYRDQKLDPVRSDPDGRTDGQADILTTKETYVNHA